MASISKRSSGQWRARYRDPAGKEHARHFRRKVDAQRWLNEVTASVVTGAYVDPKAGRVTVREYAERWRSIQAHRPRTRTHYEMVLRRYVHPVLGDRPLSAVLPSDVQAWVRQLETGSADQAPLQPATIGVAHSILSAVFKAAVRDRRLAANPCAGTRLPRVEKRKVVPPTTEAVEALRAAMPAEFQALVTFTAGTGMRQGEVFGLTVDRLDMLRRTVTVDRQLVGVDAGRPAFGPPKTDASVRDIPLPRVVVDALAAQLAAYGEGPGGVVFTLDALPIRRSSFFERVWRRSLDAADLPRSIRFHDLRHYYASLLIRHGESVKTVQARLGHASATETLDTYSHLWPDSDDRTREAVDSVLLADSLRTREAR